MQGVLSNETMGSYKWMLEQLLLTTNLPPRVVVSDADPTLLAAVPLIFPESYEIHCIFHIMTNLRKHVGLAVSDYKTFEREFLQARNCLSDTRFEQLWNELLNKYSQVTEYLNFLYQSKKCWAKAYTGKVFTAGVQSTSRTEGYNALLKKQITASATLCDLAKVLDGRSKTEQLQTAFKEWQVSNTQYQAPFVPTQVFGQIHKMLKQYVSSLFTLLKLSNKWLRPCCIEQTKLLWMMHFRYPLLFYCYVFETLAIIIFVYCS